MHQFEQKILPLDRMYYELGRYWFNQQDYKTARGYFEQAIAVNKHEGIPLYELHYAMARTLQTLEEEKEALAHYAESFEKDPEHPADVIVRAQHTLSEQLAMQHYAFLEGVISRFNALKPLLSEHTLPELLLFEGRCYMLSKKELPRAEVNFKAVTEHNPRHLYALENLGELYRRMNDTQRALEIFNQLSDNHPGTERQHSINLRKAVLFLEKGDYEAALQHTEGLTFSHSFLKGLVHKTRGKCFIQLNNPDQAIAEAERLLYADELQEDGLLIKAQALLLKNEPDTALFVVNKGLTAYPHHAAFRYLKARILIECLSDLSIGEKLLEELPDNFLAAQKPEVVKATVPTANESLFIACVLKTKANQSALATACEFVVKAINDDIKGCNTYPILYGYLVKADILQRMGKVQEAADDYVEAGKRLYWQGNYDQAAPVFEKGILCNSHHTNAYWYAADNCFMLLKSPASRPEPEQQKNLLTKGIAYWEAGMREKLPDSSEAWAYVTRARLSEGEGDLGEESFIGAARKAVYYAEQSILPGNKDYFNLSLLGRYLRLVGLPANSLLVLNQAEALKADDNVVQEEKLAALLDSGMMDEALDYLNKLDTANNGLYDSWRGYRFYYLRQFDQALPYFDSRIKAREDDVWTRYMRMLTYWHLQLHDQAQADAQWIFDKKEEDIMRKEYSAVITALWMLGHYEECIARSLQLWEDDDYKQESAYYLFHAYLLKGEWQKAEPYFTQYVNAPTSFHDLRALEQELRTLYTAFGKEEGEATGEPDRFLHDEYGIWTKVLHEKLQQRSQPNTVWEEINQLLTYNRHYAPGTMGWRALTATLARLYANDQDVISSLKAYLQLLPPDRHEVYTAENINKRMEEIIIAEEDSTPIKILYQEMTAASSPLPETTATLFQLLFAQLHRKTFKLDFKPDVYHLVTPLVVEIAAHLVPPDASNEWSYIKEDIPRMREEIKAAFGISIPGVRVRSNEDALPQNSYIIMLNEIPLVLNYVKPDCVYCPILSPETLAALQIPANGYDKIQDSFTVLGYGDAYWVDRQYEANLKDREIAVYDYFRFILDHLKMLVSKYFAEYTALQDVHILLTGWGEKHPDIKDRIDHLFPQEDIIRKVNFNKILKALLSEQVPLTDARTIILSLSAEDLEREDLLPTICSLRIALKTDLPANRPGLLEKKLPEAFEATIRENIVESGNRTTLAMLPASIQSLLSDFRNFIESEKVDTVLVEDDKSRYYAKKAFKLEFPDVYFLSVNENIDDRTNNIPTNITQDDSITESDVSRCPHCATVINTLSQRFCTQCGMPLKTEQVHSPAKKPMNAPQYNVESLSQNINAPTGGQKHFTKSS